MSTIAAPIASILGLGSYVPDKIVTNFDMEKMVETTDEWIRSRTGISQRRMARPDESTSDMAAEAGRRALADAGLEAKDVDAIVMATISPDMPWPATSVIVQQKIGAPQAFAFDVSAACSGFVYALATAASFVKSGLAKRVLVIGAEKLSSIVDYTDRNTCVLFGDGAGAAVVGAAGEGHDLLSFHLGTDGSAANMLCMPAGGNLRPASHQTVDERLHFLKMEGNQVFKFAVRVMEDASEQAIQKAGLTHADISLFVPHQANMRIIEAAARRIEVPMERVMVNLDRYGNTSAASVGIALDEANREGRLKKGDVAVLVAFGAGLTWASTAVRW
jgi:3-oxoacyl-[acyl-carrier-protein] synthase-3